MSISAVNLPINIPWKLMATSPDMMDLRHNRGISPEPWRSSMAIYAYEPPPDDLDPALCSRQITFLKITCSITGMQYSDVEQDRLIDWAEKQRTLLGSIEGVTQAYLACYGVLLHVSVSPNTNDRNVALADFPHIIDFEPKKRDLYEAATETGEILTASKGSVQTGKSFTDTKTSETGITPNVQVPLGTSGATAGAEFSQKWGTTAADTSSSSTDSSRESRETHGTTTNITQMYNLLTGYHAGTNRATFLMLPRPHNLQPTEKRTFVNGLREIEGLQEFFLIVERPRSHSGLCVEAQLQTGHFSEDVPAVPGAGAYEPFTSKYSIDEEATAGAFSNRMLTIAVTSAPFTNADVELDYDHDNPGHGPVKQDIRDEPTIRVNEHEWLETIDRPSYSIDSDGVLHVKAQYKVNGPVLFGTHRYRFRRDYTVSLKRKSGSGPATVADPGGLVIAGRTIGACISRAQDGCLTGTQQSDPGDLVLVDVGLPDFDFGFKPGAVQIQRELRRGLARASTEFRMRPGVKHLVDTQYAARRLARLLPKEALDRPARADAGDRHLADRLGDTTARELLSWSEARLARRLGTDLAGARSVRARILGLQLPDDTAK